MRLANRHFPRDDAMASRSGRAKNHDPQADCKVLSGPLCEPSSRITPIAQNRVEPVIWRSNHGSQSRHDKTLQSSCHDLQGHSKVSDDATRSLTLQGKRGPEKPVIREKCPLGFFCRGEWLKLAFEVVSGFQVVARQIKLCFVQFGSCIVLS
jgi:hypothetical protein